MFGFCRYYWKINCLTSPSSIWHDLNTSIKYSEIFCISEKNQDRSCIFCKTVSLNRLFLILQLFAIIVSQQNNNEFLFRVAYFVSKIEIKKYTMLGTVFSVFNSICSLTLLQVCNHLNCQTGASY